MSDKGREVGGLPQCGHEDDGGTWTCLLMPNHAGGHVYPGAAPTPAPEAVSVEHECRGPAGKPCVVCGLDPLARAGRDLVRGGAGPIEVANLISKHMAAATPSKLVERGARHSPYCSICKACTPSLGCDCADRLRALLGGGR